MPGRGHESSSTGNISGRPLVSQSLSSSSSRNQSQSSIKSQSSKSGTTTLADLIAANPDTNDDLGNSVDKIGRVK